MKHFAIFNSSTSGNIHTEVIAGREHLVTKMVSLVGDTVMNNILYPNDEVIKALPQLDMLPAPAGHPVVNGHHVSAAHPVAINAHNFGGFIRNPRMEGKTVVNDLCIDIEVANRDDKGREVVRRINAKEKIGVSTGLGLQIENSAGTGDDGKTYDRIGRCFNYDHVAILLNETPAGDHVGTELKYNGQELIVNEISCRSLEMQIDDLLQAEVPITGDMCHISTWSQMVFPDSKTFVYRWSDRTTAERKLFKRGYAIGAGDTVTLQDEKIEVVKKVEYVPIDGTPVINKEMSDMTNQAPKVAPGKEPVKAANADDGSDNPVTPEVDQSEGGSMTVNSLIEEAGKQGMAVITNEQADDLKHYQTNKPAIDAMTAQYNAEIGNKRKAVAEFMGLNEDQAEGLTVDIINQQFDVINKDPNYSMNAGGQTSAENTEKPSFVINNEDYDDIKTSEGDK